MRPLNCQLLLALVVGSAGATAADPPKLTPASVRASVSQLWSNDGDVAAKAVRALEAEPLALPVLRRALATDPNPRHQGDLERLIVKLNARQDAVNAKRVRRWSDEGRLDLLTEVRSLTDGKAAEASTEHLLTAAVDLRELGFKLNAPRPPYPGVERSDPWYDGLRRTKAQMTLRSDAEVLLREDFVRSDLALFADRIDMRCGDVRNSLVVCRSELTHLTTRFATPVVRGVGRCQWQFSLLFANCSVQLEQFAGCVLVVDGDLELVTHAELGASILVVNGDVRESKVRPDTRAYKSVVWATGDISITPHNEPHDSLFLAGGKVAEADKLAAKGCVEENVKEPPLPVRFLDPAEFGLTLDATDKGMKVAKVADKSAFAEAGLKVGDVIAQVGEVATATAPAFRRELRRGVVEGAVLLDVIRGKEKVELLVAVPEVPAAPK